MKHLIAFVLIVFVFIFSGCDPHSDQYRVINNQSNYDIKISFYERGSSQKLLSSKTLKAKSIDKTLTFSGLGGGRGCGNWADSLSAEIINNADKKLRIDLNNKDAFLYSQSGNSWKGFHFECAVKITDTDIVPK